jgi:dUTPase
MQELIDKGSVSVSYGVDSDGKPVAHGIQKKLGVGDFKLSDRFFGNRLSVTLGPLVLSHTFRSKPGHKQFRGLPNVYDMRQSGGRYLLSAGESVTVNTIESVQLDARLGALTFPRLSLATVGVVLAPSYIDPGWSGVLVFQIANHSRQPVELKIGEKIGATHFYRVDKTDLRASELSAAFATKSHHYGQSWDKILSEDSDPFPQRKTGVAHRNLVLTAVHAIKGHWKQVAATLSLGAVVAGLVTVGTAWTEISAIRMLPQTVQTLAATAESQGSSLSALEAASPVAGQAVLTLRAGQDRVVRSIEVPVSQDETRVSVLTGLSAEAEGLVTGASVTRVNDGVAFVDLRLSRSGDLDAELQVSVTFVVIPE